MVCVYIVLIVLLVAITRERGLKNGFEATVFAFILFALLTEVFQYL